MTEHDWFREHLDLHVAGALPSDESLRAERHAADCAPCAQELAQRRLLDRALGRVCAPVHFGGDWDQRVQARWQKTSRSLPTSLRWALTAAAVVLIGAVGAAMNALAEQGMIAFPGGDVIFAGLSQPIRMANAIADERDDRDVLINLKEAHTGSIMLGEVSKDRERTQSVNNLKQIGVDVGGQVSDMYWGRHSPAPPGNGTALGIASGGARSPKPAQRDGRAGDAAARLEGLKDLASDLAQGVQISNGAGDSSRVEWDKAPTWSYRARGKAIEDLKELSKKGAKADDVVAALPAPPAAERAGEAKPGEAGVPLSDKLHMLKIHEADSPAKRSDYSLDLKAGEVSDGEKASQAKMGQLRSGAEYFKLETVAESQNRGKQPAQQVRRADADEGKGPRALGREMAAAQQAAKKEAATEGRSASTGDQRLAEEQLAQRKIIRTGALEFEVSVFDDTVAQITKLIGAIPGAFVATVNSEKLPNGKVKGSVVVRVPPEALDKFVLDLRQGLAKTGELKFQKIGSADVTKQYTDIESRLRAARAMEERIIAIIKNGKGEVKDLIAAERELGVWRTKIEEMEGEIRYYNNQVALSTLTITVYEKEIRAAAEFVVTEHVTMKIEADDVEKSLQTALAAVTEAKGRVTKSELKQHAAGQLEALLTFAVAPAQAGAVKDKLKALGIVTHHDAQRLQQAEGGADPAGEIRSRSADVRFDVTLYNVANIQPREAYVLQVVVTDVPAEYRKLIDGVAAAQGQVRVSQLDEKDRANTFAQLDFDVPAGQRALFDKVVAGLGEIVSRNTTRAGPGETATDRKVGYRLTLKSETSVPPRDTFTLVVYSLDVPAAYRKLQDTAAQLKGHVRALNLNEQDRNNVTAQFDVDVARSDMALLDRLLDDTGEVATRSTSRTQPHEIATDRKVGYRLTLRSQIPPRETLDLNIEVADVEGSADALAALVKGAKGRVTAWEGTQDAAGKAVAIQLFDVPLFAKESLAAQIKAIGKVRGQKVAQNLQAPDGKLATAHINVRLSNATPIVPSDEGLWSQLRRSLSYAFTLLSVSLMCVVVGLSVLLPWALLGWLGVKLVRRIRRQSLRAP